MHSQRHSQIVTRQGQERGGLSSAVVTLVKKINSTYNSSRTKEARFHARHIFFSVETYK